MCVWWDGGGGDGGEVCAYTVVVVVGTKQSYQSAMPFSQCNSRNIMIPSPLLVVATLSRNP